MSKITAYKDGNEMHFKVSVGRKSQRGFANPLAALQRGIEMALIEDSRLERLISGKSLDRQVGIVFGAECRNKYFAHIE